jgi:hypothetical protein
VDQEGNLIPATEGSWTNVTGWKISEKIDGITGNFASALPPVSVTNTSGAAVATINFTMGIEKFTAALDDDSNKTLQLTLGQTNIPVTFSDPTTPGGVTAQGVGTVVQLPGSSKLGILVDVKVSGSGYTTRVPTVKVYGASGTSKDLPFAFQFNILPLSSLKIISTQLSLSPGSTGFDGASVGSVSVPGGPTVNFQKFSNLSGTTKLINGTPTFVPDTADYIPATSSGVFAFDPAQQGKTGIANFTGGAGTGHAFFGDTVSQITQGNWSYNGQSYGFTNLFARLTPLVNSLGADVVHVQPGVELVNSKGDITVSSNWNLAGARRAGSSSTRLPANPITIRTRAT